MNGILKIFLILAVFLIAIDAALLVLDIVSSEEFRDILKKVLIILVIFTGVSLFVSLLMGSRKS